MPPGSSGMHGSYIPPRGEGLVEKSCLGRQDEESKAGPGSGLKGLGAAAENSFKCL